MKRASAKSRLADGQSTLEFAVMMAVVVAALVAMNIYMKRSVSGKLRDSTDQIGGQFDPGTGSSNFTEVTNQQTNETTAHTGRVDTHLINVFSNRSGSENLTGNLENTIF